MHFLLFLAFLYPILHEKFSITFAYVQFLLYLCRKFLSDETIADTIELHDTHGEG